MTDPEEFNLYLANLEEFVFDENKIVSIGWLSRTLDIGVDLSKKLLSTFTNDKTFKSKLSTCWFLYGSSKSDPSSRKMLIVPETKLNDAKDKFEKITSQHVYSIQKTGNTDTDMNSVYLADQSAEKSIAQCSSLSNIKCDHVKVVPNRRNMAAPVTAATNSSKPHVTNNAKSSESAKKSPIKSTIGNMFNKKKEELDKKKEEKKETEISEKKKEEEEKSNKDVEKNQRVSASPVKKSTTAPGKKKGPEKGAGSANITSFFSKGASSLPPMKKIESKDKEDVKASTKNSKETNGNAKKSSKETKRESDTKKFNKEKNESDDEAMDVDVDENVEPVKTVENMEKEKDKDQKKRPIKESKSNKSKKSSAKSSEGKKKVEKKEKETQRKRIRVFSDSSDSEQEEEPERERSVSPPPPSPPRAKPAISDDEDDDVIPPTPEATVSNGGGSRKRKRKLVTKTMTDSSGFLRTVKEFETVSCSDSDGESTNPPPTGGGVVKQDAKKQKVEKKSPPPAANKTTTKSPTKSKQTSILSFFKKS